MEKEHIKIFKIKYYGIILITAILLVMIASLYIYTRQGLAPKVAADEIGESYPAEFEINPENNLSASELMSSQEPDAAITYKEYGKNFYHNTISDYLLDETFLIAQDDICQWLITPSESEEIYFDSFPFRRYDLVRIDINTGDHLVLDDLLWEDVTTANPIIFTGDRLIYMGAKEDTHLSFKDPCLISIRADGSERLPFDAQYNIIRHLSYDNEKLYYEGWTNAQEFPRPIVRMNPDFTEMETIAYIEGSLITVYKDCLYYLGSSSNKTGIYAKKLTPGSIPFIYDKLGFTAEEQVASPVSLEEGTDGRMYAKMIILELYERKGIAYSLPLYGHED